MTPEWVHELKRAGLATVAGAVGLGNRGRGWGPCPACGASKRGHDARAPLGVGTDGGWKCFACEAEGDAADLVAYRVASRRLRECDPDTFTAVRAWAAQNGLCSAEDGRKPRVSPAQRMVPEKAAGVRRIDRGGGTPDVPASLDVEVTIEPEDPNGRPPPWHDLLCLDAENTLWNDAEAEPVRLYLMGGAGAGPGGTDGRRLPEQSVRDFHLGALQWGGWWWVTIPLLDPRTGDTVNVKLRRVPAADGTCPKPKYTTCAGRPLTLFGERSLTNDFASPVIVVEGELDVIALWSYGWQGSVVSGTAGAGGFRDEWLDALESYESFVLAFDVEASKKAGKQSVGEKGAEDLAERLGKYRCARALMPRKDASECWAAGLPDTEIERAIERAKPYVGLEVIRLDAMADEIEADIRDPSRLMGRPTGSAVLDELFAGWGDGVTVLTGGTKTGKTTFAAWALRELALMGVPVLATAFEQGRSPLTQKWLRQQLRGDFTKFTEADRRRALSDLGRMPLLLASHYGNARLDDLVHTIRYHRRRNRIEIVLIDHIGYLVDLSRRDMDETRQLQHAMRTLTQLAADERIGILMIAHPSGGAEREGQRVTVHHIKGTVSIKQDCVAGLSLEWDPKSTIPGVHVHVDVLRKEWGRGTGSWGWLYFDPVSCLYADELDRLPNATIDPSRAG